MAAPFKQGLGYFPVDVDFLQDIKIRKLKHKCGTKSISVLINLFCNIYGDKGYYLAWNTDEAFVISEYFGITEDAVHEIVKQAVAVGLFDSVMYEKYQILTSIRIQKTFCGVAKQAKKKKICVRREFALIPEITELIPELTELIPEKTELIPELTNKGKERKEKGKESKGKGEETPAPVPLLSETIKQMAESVLGVVSPADYKTLCDFSRIYPEDWILQALRIATERGRPTLQYTRGILQSFAKQGAPDAPRKLQKDKTADEVMAETIAAMRAGRMGIV